MSGAVTYTQTLESSNLSFSLRSFFFAANKNKSRLGRQALKTQSGEIGEWGVPARRRTTVSTTFGFCPEA